MEGKILVKYKILYKTDFNLEIKLEEILKNEKVLKAIKSEFAKGNRNLDISSKNNDSKINIETQKECYEFEALKDDFADLLTLAEEDATSKKLFKKDHIGIELVDIKTIDDI